MHQRAAPAAPAASHDTANPPALLRFMLRGWIETPRKHGPIKHAAEHRARRAALSALYPGKTLVIPTGVEKVRANDTFYRFRPGSDFFYFVGAHEPGMILVLLPVARGKPGHRHLLLVEPNPGRSDASFFTDRQKGELWVGPRLGMAEAMIKYGVDDARPLRDLERVLAGGDVRCLRGMDPAADKASPTSAEDAAFAAALSELRLVKSPSEIRDLQDSIGITRRAFDDVLRALPTAKSERDIEGVFGLRARAEGNDVGYGTIAASGCHACTLHWTRNDGKLRKGNLLLLDAGVEGHRLYTADVTRTFPISGKFSATQRRVYDLVWESQRAAIAEVRPGNDFMAPNRAAMRVLAQGLERLGILPSAHEALLETNLFYKRYTLHNVSHMLGIDVHDCARAREQAYKHGKLEAGMVLTVEPGLYFQPDDATVPPAFRGIGVRIEDDVLVTPKGCKVLTAAFPSAADAVEAWMKAARSRKGGA
jgi:Xaa-Pro aminopeptidase